MQGAQPIGSIFELSTGTVFNLRHNVCFGTIVLQTELDEMTYLT